MKRMIFLITFLAFGFSGYTQELDQDDLKERQAAKADVSPSVDDIKNEQEFKATFDWLMETPLNSSSEKRKMVNASMAEFVEDHAEYNMDFDVKLLKFADSSPELLTVFIGGYTEYMIDNGNQDVLEANVAGAEKVIDYYEKNRDYLEKNRRIEKLIRKEEKDKLENYVDRKTR